MSDSHVQLTQDIVHELLLYDPFTGELTWRRRERKWFPSDRAWTTWNARFAGKPALNTQHRGHRYGPIFRKLYRAHRVIWLYMLGVWPYPEVDHKNRDPADNRWVNLRVATREQNARNRTLQRNNKTGFIGVWRTKSGKYVARIGAKKYLGQFASKQQAMDVRAAASKAYEYSPGHGRRALLRDGNLMETTEVTG